MLWHAPSVAAELAELAELAEGESRIAKLVKWFVLPQGAFVSPFRFRHVSSHCHFLLVSSKYARHASFAFTRVLVSMHTSTSRTNVVPFGESSYGFDTIVASTGLSDGASVTVASAASADGGIATCASPSPEATRPPLAPIVADPGVPGVEPPSAPWRADHRCTRRRRRAQRSMQGDTSLHHARSDSRAHPVGCARHM